MEVRVLSCAHMKHTCVALRNTCSRIIYKGLLKPLFFRFDPEVVHDRMTMLGRLLGSCGLGRFLTRIAFDYSNPILSQKILGLEFKNPIGLSAGFDKNAELTHILPSVGFGFAEVGSITGLPCAGNPKPRLWRFAASKSLGVYYGLKNDGCEVVAKRLVGKRFEIPIGVSVAMTNCLATLDIDTAVADYAKAFRTMEPVAGYITVNISCPNTQGGQPFVIPENFNTLFTVLDTIPTKKPIFVKLSPDMTHEEVDRLLEVIQKHRVHGLIISNLTKKSEGLDAQDKAKRDVAGGRGGLSGKVVQSSSEEILSYVYKKQRSLPVDQRLVLVGVGGVFSAEDAYRKIRGGASLVQLITGMIFEGPQVISDINKDIAGLLIKDGFSSVEHAVGVDVI